MKAQSEDVTPYKVEPRSTDDEIISKAMNILFSRLKQPGEAMSSPETVRKYLTLQSANLEHEVFSALFLDAQNRVIAFEQIFTGTLTQASVYPREVVKRALAHNAAAIILSHNHPSGVAEPSRADEMLTTSLKQALALVDVKVLDHIIIGGMDSMSFAERGLL